MPNYTENYGIYKPSRNDDLEIDTSLAGAMDKIDSTIKSVDDKIGKDDTTGVSKRIKDLETEVTDARKNVEGVSFGSVGEHVRWVYQNAIGSGGGGTGGSTVGVPRFIKKDTNNQSWEISILTDGSIMTSKTDDSPTMLAIYNSSSNTLTSGLTNYTVVLPKALSNTNYRVSVTPSWNTTVWVNNKTASSFKVNFGTAVPTNSDMIDWMTIS